MKAQPGTAALAKHVAHVLSSLLICTKGPDFRNLHGLLRAAEEEARRLMVIR